MSNIMIHSAYGLWPMLEYELDIMQRELDAGNNVIFLYCRGDQKSCPANKEWANSTPKKRYCIECKSRVEKGIDWLTNTDLLEVVEYDNINIEENI